MGRNKATPRRLQPLPADPSPSPVGILPPRPAKRSRRKRRAPPEPKITLPVYKHASKLPSGLFQGDVAVLYEIPVPSDAFTFDHAAEDTDVTNDFTHAYEKAFYSNDGSGDCFGDVAVFIKDWDPGKDVVASGLRRPNPNRLDHFLRSNDIAVNSDLLTIAIVPRHGSCRRFDVLMRADSLPVILIRMVEFGILRMYYAPERDAVQVVVALDNYERTKHGKVLPFMKSALFRWMYNEKVGGGLTVDLRGDYDRTFVYGAVRRRKTDTDTNDYTPFLECVRSNHELDVALRPYQERAVAWMLSRELGSKLDLGNVVKWEEAKTLGSNCPLSEHASVNVYNDVTIDMLHGTIWKSVDKRPAQTSERDSCGGGLLCDEMGLGKTVELMQLVLCNKLRKPGNNDEGSMPVVSERSKCMECRGAVTERERHRACIECGGSMHENCIRYSSESIDIATCVCKSCHVWLEQLLRANKPSSQLPNSKATVVVIPTTLLLQWKKEIEKHVKEALTVVVYQGHRKGYMPLKRLMAADVILVTYDALRDDVHTFNALRNPRRGLRHAKLHRPTPLPLLSVWWHRVAWDESQMLGASGVSQAAQLATYLHANNRWCISGTPMINSIRDARPMLDILQVHDGRSFVDWSSYFVPSVLREDENRLRRALRSVMWRSSKEDVNEDELQLPPQVTEVVHTTFGPVERYHYSSLQDKVRTATVTLPVGADARSRTISVDLLTMLRQACCHPQIGISGRRLMSRLARQALGPSETSSSTRYDAASQAIKRAESPLDMNEVLYALVTKAQAECAEALRGFVASANGLAATCWLQQSILPTVSACVEGIVSAIHLYRETLSLGEENKNVVQMDNIQKMHILFNLHEALDSLESTRKNILALPASSTERQNALSKLNSLGRTLRDGDLLKEVKELERNYVSEAQAQLIAAESSFREISDKLGREPLLTAEEYEEDADNSFDSSNHGLGSMDAVLKPQMPTLQWWDKAAGVMLEKDWKKQDSFLDRVIRKLLDAIPGGGLNVRTLAHRLSSIHSFAVVIPPEIRKLQEARDRLYRALLQMPGSVPPSQSQISESGQCKECREFGTGPACSHCRAEKLFEDVERRLYALRENEETIDFLLKDEQEKVRSTPSNDATEVNPKNIVDGALRPKSRVSPNFAKNAGGLRFQSELETVLKSLSLAAREAGDERLDREVSDWFERFHLMKKEHIEARAVFEAQRSYLARMDEVNMALMRLSVLAPDEDVSSLPVDEQRHRVPRKSLPTLNVQFSSEKAAAEADFRGKRGNLVFLQSLQKSGNEEMARGCSSATRGSCAVCLGEFDDSVTEVALFACGHILCCECTLLMIKGTDAKSRVSSIRCPTCRVKCSVAEINFTRSAQSKIHDKGVSNEEDREEASESDEVENTGDSVLGKRKRPGGHNDVRTCKERKLSERRSTFYDPSAAVVGLIGSKASALVRTLRGIWQQHPQAKPIIFSEWNEVLILVSRALKMNDIPHRNGAQTTRAIEFARMITDFRFSQEEEVLLLPLKKAGAGLNLTEATHVILMEPSMDVSMESQAVGRVHRIGQERDTFVHRILMKDTIEEAVLRFGDVFRENASLISERRVKLEDVMGEI